jgi:hypothetical protein
LAIHLANERTAELFVTDKFNTVNYLLVGLSLDYRNTLSTTPHVLYRLATAEVLDSNHVATLLSYYVDTKDWNAEYVGRLGATYLED